MALGNLAQRFLVAVVAVPILLVLLHYHRPEPTWALIFAASLIAMHEFFAMTLPPEDRRPAVVMEDDVGCPVEVAEDAGR